jgi:hypothetical protein
VQGAPVEQLVRGALRARRAEGRARTPSWLDQRESSCRTVTGHMGVTRLERHDGARPVMRDTEPRWPEMHVPAAVVDRAEPEDLASERFADEHLAAGPLDRAIGTHAAARASARTKLAQARRPGAQSGLRCAQALLLGLHRRFSVLVLPDRRGPPRVQVGSLLLVTPSSLGK